MSPKQKLWYWREWGAATKAAKAAGLTAPDRHHLHRRALGFDKSMLDLSNADLDKVIAEFRAVSDPDQLRPQLRQLNQPRKRMLWLIRNDKLHDLAQVLDPLYAPGSELPATAAADRLTRARKYVAAILQNKFKALDLDDLTDAQLTLLITDITRATNERRKAQNLTWPDLRAAAGTDHPPEVSPNPSRPVEVDEPF